MWACSSQEWTKPAKGSPEAGWLASSLEQWSRGSRAPPPRQWTAGEPLLPATYGKWALWALAFPVLVKEHIHVGCIPRKHIHVTASLLRSPLMPPSYSPSMPHPCCQHGLCLLRSYPHHLQHHQPPNLLCTRSPRPAPSHRPACSLGPMHASGLYTTDSAPTVCRMVLAHENSTSRGEDTLPTDTEGVRGAF